MVDRVLVASLSWVMDADADCLERVRPVLARLIRDGVAVIGFTKGDRAELEPLRAQLNWDDPFITESGSAIFTPVDHNPFSEPLGEQDGCYFVEALGCPYVQARAGLRVLANLISHPLKGYGDFTVPQLEKFLGVSEAVAHRAKAREFSEPFMTPKAVEADALMKAAEEMGFGIVLRNPAESRFSDLVGSGASVGGAIARTLDAYRKEGAASAVVIGGAAELKAVGDGDWTVAEVQSLDEWLEALVRYGAASQWRG